PQYDSLQDSAAAPADEVERVFLVDYDSRHIPVYPPYEEILGAYLSCPWEDPEDPQSDANHSGRDLERFYEVAGDDMLVPCWFRERFIRVLEVSVDATSLGEPLTSVDDELRQRLRLAEPLVGLEEPLQARTEVDWLADFPRVLAAIADRYPDTQIAIGANPTGDAAWLRDQIAEHTLCTGVRVKSTVRNLAQEHTIQVKAEALPSREDLGEYFDIRLEVGDEICRSDWARQSPWDFEGPRVYCLSLEKDLSPPHRMVREAVYGSHTVEIAPISRPRPVRVIHVPGIQLLPNPAGLHSGLEAAQTWEYRPRHDLIARLARAIVDRNEEGLAYLDVDLTLKGRRGILETSAPLIIILVANHWHARELERPLPEFRVNHRAGEDSGLEMRTRSPATLSTRAFGRLHGIASEIAIRADGRADWPLSPEEFPSRASHALTALLFDITDTSYPGFESASPSRLQAYRDLCWDIPALSRNTTES
ncbi:MAG: hypothetical protein RJP95_03120, partial [Pirellulales bacterium]